MPYVKPVDRELLEDGMRPETPGQLNYLITRLCDDYLLGKGLAYSHINDVVGALECAKLELYRRVAAPYEDDKMEDNGDVYSEEHVL